MMHRTAFDDILEACATTEPRMVAVYAVMQALLGELRRVGQAAFLRDDASCLVTLMRQSNRAPHCCSLATCSRQARSRCAQALLRRLGLQNIVACRRRDGVPYFVTRGTDKPWEVSTRVLQLEGLKVSVHGAALHAVDVALLAVGFSAECACEAREVRPRRPPPDVTRSLPPSTIHYRAGAPNTLYGHSHPRCASSSRPHSPRSWGHPLWCRLPLSPP